MPRLFVLSGDDLGRTFDFEGAVVLGRGEGADLRLRAVSVSRAHARIEPDGAAGWRLVDLGSRNGVTMNFQRVTEAPLVDGAVFHVGDLELRFRLEGAPSAPAPIVTLAPPVTAAPVDEVELGLEIELEGEWEDVPAPPPQRAGAAPASPPLRAHGAQSAQSAQSSLRAQSSQSASSARDARSASTGGVDAAGRDREARRAELLRKAGGGAAAARGGGAAAAGQRPVLQYARTAGGGGVLGGDLAQRPWYMRLAIWIAALGLLGGMAYGALHLTRKLRAGEAALTAPIDDDAAVDDATAR